MKSFFKAIAFIFHPLFMPIFGALIVMYSVSYFHFSIDPRIKTFLLILMSVIIVGPAISLGVMISKKMISDVQINDRKERFAPFFLMIFWYAMAYYLLRSKLGEGYLPDEIYSMFLGVIISLIVVMIISFRFKISIHTLGVSGILGTVTALARGYSFYKPFDELFWIYLLILILGFVGASRVYTKNHTISEVFFGGLVGFTVNYFLVSNVFVI